MSLLIVRSQAVTDEWCENCGYPFDAGDFCWRVNDDAPTCSKSWRCACGRCSNNESKLEFPVDTIAQMRESDARGGLRACPTES